MTKLAGAVVVLALALTACQTTPQRPPATQSFSATEAAYIKKPGTGVITGHAFRTRATGTVVNAAGEVVRLIPATAYAQERITQLYGDRKFVPVARYPRQDTPDPAYAEHTRTVKSQANGRFRFDNVPPGRYFITAQIIWGDDEKREGGSVYDIVTLTGRETEPVDIILSGN